MTERWVEVKPGRWVNFEQVSVISLVDGQARIQTPAAEPIHVVDVTSEAIQQWLHEDR
jgi:hypothetical protein